MSGTGLASIGAADPAAPRLVLASASTSRRVLLERAGVPVAACEAARVDETEVKNALRVERADAAMAAQTLAELKAQRVARRHHGSLVIGADQILECDGVWFDKPSGPEAAAAQLHALSGRRHTLMTAVCVVRDTDLLWHHVDRPVLTMRTLGDEFIRSYLEAAGDGALASVGAYQLEGLGVQLFSRIEGDYFAILGLPLLPLIDFLRQHRVVPS